MDRKEWFQGWFRYTEFQASSFNVRLICEFFFHSFSRRLSIRSRIVPARVRGSLTIPAPDLIGKEEKDDAWYTNGYFGIDAWDIFYSEICIYIFSPAIFFFFFVVPFRIDAQSREKVIASSKNVEFQPRRCWIVWNHDGYLSFRDRRRWKVVEIKLICIFFFQYPIHFAQVILTSLRNIRFIIGSLKKLYRV